MNSWGKEYPLSYWNPIACWQSDVNLVTCKTGIPNPVTQLSGGSASTPHSGTIPVWERACDSGTSKQSIKAAARPPMVQ